MVVRKRAVWTFAVLALLMQVATPANTQGTPKTLWTQTEEHIIMLQINGTWEQHPCHQEFEVCKDLENALNRAHK